MTAIPVDLDPATQQAIGLLSAVMATGAVPDAVVRNVAHGLADVARQVRLDVLAVELCSLEPTDDELEQIEAEGDVIAAELAVVDAEIRHLDHPTVESRRHLRRAQHALERALTDQANRTQGDPS